MVGSCAAIFFATCRCLASAAARGCGQVEPNARPTSAACTPPSLHPDFRRPLPLTSPVRPRHSLTGDLLSTCLPLPARPLSDVWQRSGGAAADAARLDRQAAPKARRVASAAHERFMRSIEGEEAGSQTWCCSPPWKGSKGQPYLLEFGAFNVKKSSEK